MITRCKFKCDSVAKVVRAAYETHEQSLSHGPGHTEVVHHPEGFTYNVQFSAVYNNSPENKKFWEWTPSGTLQFQSINADVFAPGKEYFLDISLAEKK